MVDGCEKALEEEPAMLARLDICVYVCVSWGGLVGWC